MTDETNSVTVAGRMARAWLLLPFGGTIAFACLYLAATFLYPGGSQADRNAKGFSWTQNYWCNLLNEQSINGQHNTARPIAMTALLVLCLTLAFFWYVFPLHAGLPKNKRLAVQLSGFCAMGTGLFIFTAFHDLVVNLACIFGLVAMAGTFAGLKKLKWNRLFWLGVFNLLLAVINNILYYGNGLRVYLPVVQKITFVFFLGWIACISLRLFAETGPRPVPPATGSGSR